MKPMVEVKNLKKYYGKGENLVKAVDHTNLTYCATSNRLCENL